MTIRKSILVALVLLSGSNLLQRGALAQSNQQLRMHPANTDRITVSPVEPADQNREVHKKVKESLSEALDAIRKNHVDGKALNYNHIFKSAITVMLHSLDPHSNYYDAKELDGLRSHPRVGNVGIGLTIDARKIGGDTGMFVLAPMQNSTAATAGLRFGDKITAIDNWDVRDHTLEEVREKIRGGIGTQVKLTIERAADNVTHTVVVTRAALQQISVPDAYMLRPGVGYIDLSRGFDLDAAQELTGKLDKLQKEGVTSLVLDLRENQGGVLHQAISIADNFVSEGQLIVTFTSRKSGSADRRYKAQNRTPQNSPLAVLVNHKTSSGAEMVAGTLQDHDRALIVGESTIGQSLVQSVIPLPYGSALAITTGKLILPSGRLIQRDYSKLGYHEYQSSRGRPRESGAAITEHRGPEWKTDTGRSVYGGAGIMPDEVVEPRALSSLEQRMIDPIFGFVRELVNGRAGGFDAYLVRGRLTLPATSNPMSFQLKTIYSEPSRILSRERRIIT